MPRKAFLSDLQVAIERGASGISEVCRGDDDGDVNFVYTPASGPPILAAFLALDVAGYPAENSYMIFTKSSDVPKGANEALMDVATASAGSRIQELLNSVSQTLSKVLATGSEQDPFVVADEADVEMAENIAGDPFESNHDDDDDEDEVEFDQEYDSDDEFDINPGSRALKVSKLGPEAILLLNRRIKQDLRDAKLAGFSIGVLSGMKGDSIASIVSLSMKAARLGLSDEVLQAWDLEPQQHIVVLVRYSSGYKSFDSVISDDQKALDIEFQIGVCRKYKPTLVEALAAFTGHAARKDPELSTQADTASTVTTGFSSMFISSSLNEFINKEFLNLLKIRNATGLGWDGAKHCLNDRQANSLEPDAKYPDHYYRESPPKQDTLPKIMYADPLTETTKEVSLPLLAAQFAFRYLLQCTDFCLICHDRIEEGFEALKPYVCEKPLCLFQYVNFGFGPSVEHEILMQPYVVDLLVSFCYSAAMHRRIRELPTGMSLKVPPVPVGSHITCSSAGSVHPSHRQTQRETAPVIKKLSNPALSVKYDPGNHELLLDGAISSPVCKGDWVIIEVGGIVEHSISSKKLNVIGQPAVHCRVNDTSLFPTIHLANTTVSRSPAHPMTVPSVNPDTPAMTPPPAAFTPASLTIYNESFDDMHDIDKAETIVMLLQTLPSVPELRDYLVKQSRSSETSLGNWCERVSPAALVLLRWIIASNRSCIVQVDKCPGQDASSASKIRLDQKCSEVPANWLQFRFAQGSPDKEQRFLAALKEQATILSPKFPTMFAFHGSSLQNWHSIIRHGLDFKETVNGRAYGHGVYHALDQQTSLSYCQRNSNLAVWPGSTLKIAAAMSLNEIVNCPPQWISSAPYVVVQHTDWIQCRYLFVQVDQGHDAQTGVATPSNIAANLATNNVEQDPKFTAQTMNHKPIGIPQCAISASRAFRQLSMEGKAAKKLGFSYKRAKRSDSSDQTLLSQVVSEDEDLEDIRFLLSDDETRFLENNPGVSASSSSMSKSDSAVPKSDFVPKSLDQDSLPILMEPQYATRSATLRLNKELQSVLKVQDSTPLHELGWYINPDLVNNVYQWIVELHSFPSEVPLAVQMKAAGITSIVLEIRFGKDYPHSPPFVRVIKPRFLPFQQGGGGHVTSGGAMCMELLTNSGWSAVSSIEGVLLQVRMAIMNPEPRPAQLEHKKKENQGQYGTVEAMDGYRRACMSHGWEIPKDFQDFASGSYTVASSSNIR